MNLIINNNEFNFKPGQTILDVARVNGIEIPTLCHDERLEYYGACGICTVEVAGNPRLVRACSAPAADGMVVLTDTERIHRSRKTVLELLLSDHVGDCKAPCVLACPAETDCQGYVGLIASGDFAEAYRLIMERLPLPASIGRVCPHPCEDACRREMVEEPVSVAALKVFAADTGCAPAQPAPRSGDRAAVIGGGPGGLSAAYFLRLKGHSVTVFDAMPEMGGMLRYGIPEYRLPKAILQKEIDVIRNIGVEFRNNAPVALGDLREDYDAVIIAAGAWASSPLRCKGEELAIDGIKFLHELPSVCGKTVAVVGGGNTAMDACRTAVRLGAERVYNIYRRTRAEMPADAREVTEAEEEGVIFKFLVNPIEITGSGAPASLRLRIMELGEPDASGRRAPVETDREESLAVDIVISAIGQKLNPKGFGGVELTEWGTIKADEAAFCTNLQGVWAIGDAVNDGAGIAVSAIGHARKAAEAVHAYLSGHTAPDTPLYFSKTEKTPADFSDEPKKPRISPPLRPPAERRNDFDEISTVFTEEQARREAQRCLGCGCPDYKKCKLIEYANSYGATPERFGSLPSSPRSGGNAGTALPGITQTPEKCILCGLCVRFCEEEVDAGLLGFVGRGYGTAVRAEGDVNPCADCGKCAELCPTGALHKS